MPSPAGADVPEHKKKSFAPSLVSSSLLGGVNLIALQFVSRAATFAVNQVLLRFLSPELLGISTQLELYAISVLFFARESLRVALQRQGNEDDLKDGSNISTATANGDGNGDGSGDGTRKAQQSYGFDQRIQEVVNLSYIATALGPVLAFLFGTMYLSSADPVILNTPYIQVSVCIYGAATFLELCAEPCFAAASQMMAYTVRTSAEGAATIVRCFLTCGIAYWASRNGQPLGALPFAAGQLGFAMALNVVYRALLWRRQDSAGGFSLFPRPIDRNSHLLSLFPPAPVTLALTLSFQSTLKHLLTQGDSLLMSLLTSLSAQGIYALASNYGSLLARVLFQPIEETSRSVFGRLLSSPASPPASALRSARSYLVTLLRAYALLSLLIAALGPTLAPLLLRHVAGPAWARTPAGHVLARYCYYVPLLAFNGLLEALVSAVATPAQLRAQSAWMLAFSAGFVAAGWVLLGVYGLGAVGLVGANAANMGMRIVWSGLFVRRYFGSGREGAPTLREVSPRWETLGVAAGTAVLLGRMGGTIGDGVADLAQAVLVAAVFGLTLLYLERRFLLDCFAMLRPSDRITDRGVGKKAS